MILIASSAHASEWYYTYGGFTPTVEAFTLVRDIFLDVRYGELLYGIALLGVLGGFIALVLPGFMGHGGLHLGKWVSPIVIGLLLIIGFIAPKSDLVIYDPILNEQREVRDLPVGLVWIASTFNAVEKVLIEIVTPASGKTLYENDGGVGFQALFGVANSSLPDHPATRTLTKYIESCVMFELDHPKPRLTVEDLTNKSTDFIVELAKAANPAIYTVVYSDQDPFGTPMRCDEAHAVLRGQLTHQDITSKTFNASCEDAGFLTQRASGLQSCRNAMSRNLSYVYGNQNSSPDSFMGQVLVARALEHVVTKLDPNQAIAAISNRNQLNAGLSAGVVAGNWLPILRAVFTAVGIGIFPVLCLLLPTALGTRALQGIFGMFIFLTLWGVCDSILTGLSYKLSLTAFEDIRNHNMGMVSIMLWPRATQKALAYFGFVRSSSMTIAVFISTMIGHFGGHALANLASGMMGAMQGEANQAGQTVGTVEGKARQVEAWRSSIPTLANAERVGFDSDVAARSARTVGAHAGEVAAMEQFGGPQGYEDTVTKSAAVQSVQSTGQGVGQYDAGLGDLQSQSLGKGKASVTGPKEQLETFRETMGDPKASYEEMFSHQDFSEVPSTLPDDSRVVAYGFGDNKWRTGKNEAGGWTENANGEITSAHFNNVAFRKVLNNQSALTQAASKRIANRVDWGEAYSDTESFAKRHDLSESQATEVKESLNREIGKILSTDNSITRDLSDETRKWLKGSITASAGIGGSLGPVKLGAEVSSEAGLETSHTDRKNLTHTQSAQERDALEKLFQKAATNATNNSLTHGGSNSWAKSLSYSSGSSEEKALVQSATRTQSISDSEERNLNAAMTKYVKEKYDLTTGDAIRKINGGYEWSCPC
jgi:conjugal transfer mating pair stabilization protein TraG